MASVSAASHEGELQMNKLYIQRVTLGVFPFSGCGQSEPEPVGTHRSERRSIQLQQSELFSWWD